MTETQRSISRPTRRGRWRLWALLTAAAAVVMGTGLYLFQPWQLFTTTTVDDALPAGVPAGALDGVPAAGAAGDARAPASGSAAPSRPAGPVVLANGAFRSYEHDTSGTATLFTAPDGTVVLRLSGFATSNGPDVKVWLAKTPADAAENARAAAYLDLGVLKGNRGNQNYVIPAGTDVSEYASVVIWCDRFSVPFGAAPLAGA